MAWIDFTNESFVYGLITGFITGFTIPVVIYFARRGYISYRKWDVDKRLLPNWEHALRRRGFFCISRWNAKRRLARDHVVETSYESPGENPLVPTEEILQRGSQYRRRGITGAVACLRGFKFDYQENEENRRLHMVIGQCDYSEYMAVADYFLENRERRRELVESLSEEHEHLNAFLRNSFPSNIVMNVVPVTADWKEFLAFRRSGAVASAREQWCVGTYETMNFPMGNTGGDEFTLYSLAHRCLREEVGLLDSALYHEPFISWFGYAADTPGINVIAFARMSERISKKEVIGGMKMKASGEYEADACAWLPIDSREIYRHLEGQPHYHSQQYPRWISLSAVPFYEMVRIKGMPSEGAPVI